MKKLLKTLLYAVAVLCLTEGCFSAPFQSRTTTIFGTVTDNDTKLPVSNLEIVIYGQKGVLGSVSSDLKKVSTDSNGKYNVDVDAPKEFHSLGVGNNFDSDKSLVVQYRDYLIFLNGQQTQNCCRVEIGSKTQYDFIMIPK
ncbi:hypothetical protein P1X15_21440 [Runella sp. MFBS21]|uniref:hypothetical protein n=1 Tax=Runella sp. MFBS21 TaxID=3034018 RepID=UPI0023F8E934|nr:hypothetical protein [Runella sp. MFBS21]MDF7820198.1 hypothetical protein [Runella sp. MFBS21]